jgi:hypothetical protein
MEIMFIQLTAAYAGETIALIGMVACKLRSGVMKQAA